MPLQPISSRMAIRGHPIHPLVIHFPVAALIALVGADLAYLFTGDAFWARAALWLAGVGAAGGWVSGIIGLLDLTLVYRIRRLIAAWCHGILAVMLLSLATLNWLLRFTGDPEAAIFPLGLYLTVLSSVLVAVTGALGGQLVYEYGVAVDIESAAKRHVRV